ncbi:PP2C family protein-serine/threonine phosphatase [Streptomyces sp. L7]
MTDQLLVHGLYRPVEEDEPGGRRRLRGSSPPLRHPRLHRRRPGQGPPGDQRGLRRTERLPRGGRGRAHPHRRGGRPWRRRCYWHNSFAAQTGERERFVTAIVLGVDGEQEVQAINCGHVAPLLLHEERADPGAAAGALCAAGPGRTGPRAPYRRVVRLPADGTLLLCTDGVTEARDPSGAFYPLEERAAAWGDVLPKDVPATVYGDLRRHTAGMPRDDTALLVLRRRAIPASSDGVDRSWPTALAGSPAVRCSRTSASSWQACSTESLVCALLGDDGGGAAGR